MKKFNLNQYTLDVFFKRTCQIHANRPALANLGQTPLLYHEFEQTVETLQHYLSGLGVTKGTHIAICGPSSVNWAVSFMALTTMGAVAVTILEEFPEADINHILLHSNAKGLIIDTSLYERYNFPAISQLDFVLSINDFSTLHVKSVAPDFLSKLSSISQLIIKRKKNPDISNGLTFDKPISESDPAEIVYTSGTTGFSKGVVLTHGNLVSNLFEGPDMLGVIDDHSVILHFLPMAHTFGSTSAFLSIIYKGALIYFMGKKPSPRLLLKAMQEIKPTIIGAVPLIFEKILHKQVLPELKKKKAIWKFYRFSIGRKLLYKAAGKKIKHAFGGRLQCAIIGGAKLNREVEIFLREANIPFSVGYGLTECSPLVTFSSMDKLKMGSVGRAITDVSIKIDNPSPSTGVGEIWIKGPNVMAGYYKNEALTQQVFTPDGWFKTGDKGYLDSEGFLYITGRSKNVIIGPSGENIYPEVIEEKFSEHFAVEEVLVYQAEQFIVARIYPDFPIIEEMYPNIDSDQLQSLLDKIRQEVNALLPSFYRVHKVVLQKEPFDKTPTNKIKRFEYNN